MINKYLTKNNWYFLILLLISLLLICLHSITYVGLEQPIYYWDYSNYSSRWQYLSQLQERSTVAWLRILIDSVKYDEYNLLPVALLFPFYHFPLDNRVSFILAISICYLTPVILLLTLLFKRIAAYHHHLPFALWFFILAALGLNSIIKSINSINLKKVILVVGALFSTIVFAFTFYEFGFNTLNNSNNYLKDSTSFSNHLFPIKTHPLRIENFNNYQRLGYDIEQWCNDDKKITFLASSFIFNESMISSITQFRINHCITAIHVDLRDRLGIERFLTDYIVVGDPVQTHLSHGQNVIIIPAQELLSGTGIGAAYQRLPYEYELAQGVKAVVFEKIRPFTQQEIQDFLAKFVDIYPDWANIYLSSPLTTSYMTADILLGDSPYSTFKYHLNDNIIFAYPGETKPVQVHWEFGDIQALTIAVPDEFCGVTDGVLIQLSNEDNLQRSVEVAAMSVVTIDVSDFAHTKGTLIIDNNGTNACDSVFFSAK